MWWSGVEWMYLLKVEERRYLDSNSGLFNQSGASTSTSNRAPFLYFHHTFYLKKLLPTETVFMDQN